MRHLDLREPEVPELHGEGRTQVVPHQGQGAGPNPSPGGKAGTPMMREKNQRVYLVLDPDEAEAVEHILAKLTHGPKIRRILERLKAAMERAREKGAPF